MIIYGVYFCDKKDDSFETLTEYWLRSIKKNTNHSVITHRLEYEITPHGKQNHFNNLRKLEYWNKFVQESDQDVILMDTDMIILKPLDIDYKDIAITIRENNDIRYNAGVVYVKNTPIAKKIINEWYQASYELFNNMDKELLKQYKGLTQSALNIIEKKYSEYFTLLECDEFNLAATDWINLSDKTRAIHIKDYLRKYCLSGKEPKDPIQKKIFYIWNQYKEY